LEFGIRRRHDFNLLKRGARAAVEITFKLSIERAAHRGPATSTPLSSPTPDGECTFAHAIGDPQKNFASSHDGTG